MLDAPVNPASGHPLIPSRQLCAIWVAKAWDIVPEKSWEVGNCAKHEDLQRRSSDSSIRTVIVEHEKSSIVQAILESSDHEAVDNYLCEDNVNCDEDFDDSNSIA